MATSSPTECSAMAMILVTALGKSGGRAGGRGRDLDREIRDDPLGRRVSKETAELRTEYSYAGQDATEEKDFERNGGAWTLSETRGNAFGNGSLFMLSK